MHELISCLQNNGNLCMTKDDFYNICKVALKPYFPLASSLRNLGHTIVRETQNLQVAYYVDKNFESHYKGEDLEELEKEIEKEYIDYVQTNCRKEKQQSKLVLSILPMLTRPNLYKPLHLFW